MKARRGSILGLMAVVGFVAPTMGAVRSASTAWVAAYVGLATAALLVAAFLARFARDRPTRDRCFGFAACGSAYLLLSTYPINGWLEMAGLDATLYRVFLEPFQPFARDASYSNARHLINNEYYRHAIQIARAATAIFFACLGAPIAAMMGRRAARHPDGSPRPESPESDRTP